LEYVLSSRADGFAPSPEWVVALQVSGLGHRQVAFRGSMSMNLGGSRIAQELLELVLQFPTLSFCSLYNDRRRAKSKKEKKTQKHTKMEKQLLVFQCDSSHSTWAFGLFHAIKR
jgi:hypothetical protein